MTDEEVRAFLGLADAATKGEWKSGDPFGDFVTFAFGHVAATTQGAGGAEQRRRDAAFIAASRTAARYLAAEVLKLRPYVAELERVVHDAAQGVMPAALLAKARRLGREEMAAALVAHSAVVGPGTIRIAERRLPPLPAESPTARELRERAAALEADNARLREALEAIYQPGTRTLLDARNQARAALEATE